MSISFITTALFVVSVATNLTVEAVKAILRSIGVKYSSTILAAVLSVIIAICACVAYAVMYSIDIGGRFVVQTLAFSYISFLVSTVGYDKVIQAFSKAVNSNK